MKVDSTLDQLAEQAVLQVRALYAENELTLTATSRIVREALEAATQALREQLDTEKARADAAVANWLTAEKLGASWFDKAEAAELALTAQREDLERYRATVELARGLPFCGHRDCEGGQHPARTCLGCETLWERWREALAACTPTKSAP